MKKTYKRYEVTYYRGTKSLDGPTRSKEIFARSSIEASRFARQDLGEIVVCKIRQVPTTKYGPRG